MELRWERAHRDLYRGLSDEGIQLAQVARVGVPRVDGGGTGPVDAWMVWLSLQQGELFDQYTSAEEAMVAAEAAVDLDPG